MKKNKKRTIQPLSKKQLKSSRFYNAVVREDWKHGQRAGEAIKLRKTGIGQ